MKAFIRLGLSTNSSSSHSILYCDSEELSRICRMVKEALGKEDVPSFEKDGTEFICDPFVKLGFMFKKCYYFADVLLGRQDEYVTPLIRKKVEEFKKFLEEKSGNNFVECLMKVLDGGTYDMNNTWRAHIGYPEGRLAFLTALEVIMGDYVIVYDCCRYVDSEDARNILDLNPEEPDRQRMIDIIDYALAYPEHIQNITEEQDGVFSVHLYSANNPAFVYVSFID